VLPALAHDLLQTPVDEGQQLEEKKFDSAVHRSIHWGD